VQGDEFDYIVGDDDNEYGGEVNDEEEANDKSSLEQRRDEYGYRRFALLLNSENFKRNVNAHGVLLVNFHAPWCSHCAALAPHFERGAQLGISHYVILFTHLFNNTISQFKKLSQSH
jgi:thiol-disulfide isomerase/thioredoxin